MDLLSSFHCQARYFLEAAIKKNKPITRLALVGDAVTSNKIAQAYLRSLNCPFKVGIDACGVCYTCLSWKYFFGTDHNGTSTSYTMSYVDQTPVETVSNHIYVSFEPRETFYEFSTYTGPDLQVGVEYIQLLVASLYGRVTVVLETAQLISTKHSYTEFILKYSNMLKSLLYIRNNVPIHDDTNEESLRKIAYTISETSLISAFRILWDGEGKKSFDIVGLSLLLANSINPIKSDAPLESITDLPIKVVDITTNQVIDITKMMEIAQE